MIQETDIRNVLEASGVAWEIITCDPALADTDVFCAHYGYAPEESANTIIVKTKTGDEKFAVCVVLATTRLDVNKTVRKKLGARKVSFASTQEAERLTGMTSGGVMPLVLPAGLTLWVDERIMALDRVILGGGSRSLKVIVAPAIFNRIPEAEIVPGLALDAARK